MTKAEAEKEIRAVGRTCKGPYVDDETALALTTLFAAGHTKAAERLAAVSRKGCGTDFNDTVVAGPWDGEEHPYKCPKCGLTGTYRAPDFGVLSA